MSNNTVCKECNGSGKTGCKRCGKGGYVLRTYELEEERDCPSANCSGGLFSPTCRECGGDNPECGSCGGTGMVLFNRKYKDAGIPDTHVKGYTHLTFSCRVCNGSGKVIRKRQHVRKVMCPECEGNPPVQHCTSCGGTGHKGMGNHIDIPEEITQDIPRDMAGNPK